MKKKITIFGSTGSVGKSTLDIIKYHEDKFELVGLTVNKNYTELVSQIKKFKPKVVSIRDEDTYKKFKSEYFNLDVIVCGGENSLLEILDYDTDFIMAGIVGSAGLKPIFEAAKKGISIGLANKESLVCSGKILKSVINKNNCKLIPIDSEHNAIFQVFEKSNFSEIDKILLTASGGPFLGRKLSELTNVTPEQAVSHPNWIMGKKISVDSATLMNKGLEFIEAFYLFDMPTEKIDVIIHPQSIVHSCVGYTDGSILAQMGTPDMRTPIAYALGFPSRMSAPVERLNLLNIKNLNFIEPDHETFPALKIAINAINIGKNAPTVLNAANEVAVDAFLNKKIPFLSISKIVDLTLNKSKICELESIEHLIHEDLIARQIANEYIISE